MEVRNESGDEYPPTSLYSLYSGLQRSLRDHDINIFTDFICQISSGVRFQDEDVKIKW